MSPVDPKELAAAMTNPAEVARAQKLVKAVKSPAEMQALDVWTRQRQQATERCPRRQEARRLEIKGLRADCHSIDIL